jgi:hypothetical protein
VSLLILLSNSGAVQAFGGSMTPLTFAQWLAATNGGGGPTRYWPMSETSGTTMTASIGGIDGTYQNTGDLELNITDAASEKWVGFGGAQSNPGHATIATALQSAEFTALLLVQFDLVKAKHILLTTGGGSTPGQFSFELVDDGAGGLKPRVWSVNDSGQPVIYVGTNQATIPVGTSCALFYLRRADGTQEVWCVTSAGAVSQIALTLNSGTPPASWSAHPTGTWYLGAWSTGASPLDGVGRSLALWDVALAPADISALGSIAPKIQDVVWARDSDAGEVAINGALNNHVISGRTHPSVGFTPAIITQGSLGTWSVVGTQLGYSAGGTAGLDTQGQYRISKGGVQSPTRGLTIEVVNAGATADLPYFGQYYGGAPFGASNAANLKLRSGSLSAADSFFFRADRTGVIDKILMHWRTYLSGYAAGDGGTYTIQIRPADPNTRKPITSGAPICQVTGISPGSTSSNSWKNLIHDFTTTGQVIAKQPYCIVWINTHADPAGNHVSNNIGSATAFDDPTDPADYQEPAGINPANVGSSITPVSGWSPVMIDGTIRWHQWPAIAEAGVLHYRRLGGLYGQLRYSDGIWVGPGGAYGGAQGYKVPISGNNHLRERFRVTRATRVVSGVFLRVVRLNASSGSLTFSLESGPASDTSGNGTIIEQVTFPASNIFDVGGGENVNGVGGAAIDFVPWTWFPFTQNRTLTLGQIYNARVFSPSGNFSMWCNGRGDSFMQGPDGRDLTWAEWEDQRQIEWTAWEDSRGMMVSSNAGSTWGFSVQRLAMILFKCV